MDYKKFVLELKNKGFVIGDDVVGYRVNPYFELPKSLAFSEVALKQAPSEINSRLDTDISSEFVRGLRISIPLLAANMSSVVNADFCIFLYKLGALGILHRAWKNEELYLKEVCKVSSQCKIVAVSVGAGLSQVSLATRLINAGATIITIDIAQGYNKNVFETGKKIRLEHPQVKIIVGNVINPQAMYEADSFADAVKVGIAQGSHCLTAYTAGCTAKMWSVVDQFEKISSYLGLPVIADGSISDPSDFTKAIAAGASSCMAGKIFARCPESAAEEVEIDGERRKHYYGMASKVAQEKWRGGLKKGTCAEGKSSYLPIGQGVSDLLERFSGALRSGLTYVGASNIKEFQERSEFIRL